MTHQRRPKSLVNVWFNHRCGFSDQGMFLEHVELEFLVSTWYAMRPRLLYPFFLFSKISLYFTQSEMWWSLWDFMRWQKGMWFWLAERVDHFPDMWSQGEGNGGEKEKGLMWPLGQPHSLPGSVSPDPQRLETRPCFYLLSRCSGSVGWVFNVA